MRERAAILRTICLLGLIALVVVQAFGPGSLYWCACGDDLTMTRQVGCTPGQCEGEPTDEGAPACPDHHDAAKHFTARDEMNTGVAVKLEPPVLPLLAVVSWPLVMNLPEVGELGKRWGRDARADSPPMSLAVARAMVLLI